MRRGFHVLVSVLAVVLLVRPFDCFASGKLSRETMDCCLKGKCTPSAQSDDCCKNNTVPDGGQLVLSKVGDHSAPLVAVTIASVSVGTPELLAGAPINTLRHPPPLTSLTGRNLPLLI